jgi:predicted NACHT family NTPase
MTLELTMLSKSLASLVAKTILDGGIHLVKDLNGQIKHLLYEASGQYVDLYARRHGRLKVLEMSRPVELELLYTATQLLEEPRLKQLEPLERLESLCREFSGRTLDLLRVSKREGLEMVNDHQYLVVLGGPGAGKSTFLRKVGLEALKGESGRLKLLCIPVVLELKQVNLDKMDLEHAIAREFEICGFPLAEKFVVEALSQGRLLLLLDGLDEVPKESRNRLVDVIQDFVDRYHKNRFILSCRTPAYIYHLRQFTDVEVADFDDRQIEAFTQKWFNAELDLQMDTAGKLWRLLQQPENSATKELAKTPLLLTFICLVYDRDLSLPDNRGLLYGKALDILLRQWSAEKRIEPDPIYQGLFPELEKLLLAELAFKGFETDRLFLPEGEVLQQIQAFLTETLNASVHLDSKSVLTAIEEQQGILVKQAENVYSFSHLTLQEYLTARYVAIDHRRVKELVVKHLTDSHWHEVFLLVAGLTNSGDELLLHIEEEAQKYIDSPRLRSLISWVVKVTANSDGKSGSLTQRIFAILIALTLTYDHNFSRALTLLRTLAFAHDYTLAGNLDIAQAQAHTLAGDFSLKLADLMYELARKLEESKVLDQVNLKLLTAKMDAFRLRTLDEHQNKLTEKLWQTWLEIFQLNQEMVNLSKEETEKLENYLDANLLLLQCKKSAVRVLRTTWEQVEQRMLAAGATTS